MTNIGHFFITNVCNYAFFLSAAQHFLDSFPLVQEVLASADAFDEQEAFDLLEQLLESADAVPEQDFFDFLEHCFESADAFDEQDFFASAVAHDFLASVDLDAQHAFFVSVVSTLVSALSTFTPS